MQRIVSLVAQNRKIMTRSVKMNIVHDETVKVVFDEDFIIELLTKSAVDEYYNIKYNGFKKRSAVVNNENGLTVELVFDKMHRNDLAKEDTENELGE
jgi:hypothetical protein